MVVSLLLLTLDRYDLTVQCIDQALRFAGPIPEGQVELLVCDNGSTDRRVVDYIKTLNPVYHRLNETNEGIGPMYNQLILRATGEYLCIIDPDILLPNWWLARLVDYAKLIPSTGVSGLHCVEGLWPLVGMQPQGVQVHYGSVFGTKFIPRYVIDKIGYFSEEYVPYGFEDADFGERVRQSGLSTYYIPGLTSQHIGHDCAATQEYRRMKDESLTRNCPKFGLNLERYRRGEGLYIAGPELR